MNEKQLKLKLKNDFEYYSEKNLRIRAKIAGEDGKIVPFKLNKAQKYVHERIEAHKKRYGRVRALLLKGRQQGCSTYTGGRFYHKTTHSRGLKTFILTHKDDATANLFGMVQRFHKHCNPLLKPHTQYSSKKELVFDILDSSYGLGTAGSGNTGRSDTIDLFHGSEVAFWKNIDDIKTGVMQAASAAEEIILESTANGFDAMFYPMWRSAEAGMSEYEAIFVPWFWQDEYSIIPHEDFELNPDEQELLALYEDEGLTIENIAWRRRKLDSEFNNDEILFKQEYPCTASEAFQVTGLDPYIEPEVVLRARKCKESQMMGAHIVGIDPARGGDRTYFMHRIGKSAWEGFNTKTPDTKVIIGKIRELFETVQAHAPVDWVFIDIGGLGGPIYDQVKDMPFGSQIIPVNFGSKDVYKKDRYVNKAAEMWGEMKDWFEDDVFQAAITDSDEIQQAICTRGYHYDHMQRIYLQKKEELDMSPDPADALGLTFAKPVGKFVVNTFIDNDVSVLLN